MPGLHRPTRISAVSKLDGQILPMPAQNTKPVVHTDLIGTIKVNRLAAFVRLMRPHHWVKNVFVLMGLVFGYAWAQPDIFWRVGFAFASFCFMASAVYILNDWHDRDLDRLHPKKRLRPLASGEVQTGPAIALAMVLFGASVAFAGSVGFNALVLLLSYLLLNVVYSKWLKHMVLLDVFALSAGFQIRILAGTIGVGIPPSKWLILCGFMFTLFLGFAKRRAEMFANEADTSSRTTRKVLKHYSAALLDKYLIGTGIGAVICYSLYTVDPATVSKHGTESLVYTVPLVLYAVYRYLYLLHKQQIGEDPTKEFIGDRHILITAMVWLISVILLVRH